jgi:hypothetical protein
MTPPRNIGHFLQVHRGGEYEVHLSWSRQGVWRNSLNGPLNPVGSKYSCCAVIELEQPTEALVTFDGTSTW